MENTLNVENKTYQTMDTSNVVLLVWTRNSTKGMQGAHRATNLNNLHPSRLSMPTKTVSRQHLFLNVNMNNKLKEAQERNSLVSWNPPWSLTISSPSFTRRYTIIKYRATTNDVRLHWKESKIKAHYRKGWLRNSFSLSLQWRVFNFYVAITFLPINVLTYLIICYHPVHL
jgi:hypothetical protein